MIKLVIVQPPDTKAQGKGMYYKTLSKIEESIAEMNPVWEAQTINHLKLTGKRLGFLINFNVPLIKNGIKRIIL
ncbi:MAG: GxxExxY protein [Thermodesulfobacteriota bacterium]|nr:GxxExxY protein [Thermodesulfobacteriota bacterium]